MEAEVWRKPNPKLTPALHCYRCPSGRLLPLAFVSCYNCVRQGEGADAGDKNGGPQQKTLRAAANGVSGAPSAAAVASGSSSSSKVSPAFHHGQELELAGLACVVKLYDFREGQVKLNDTVEFVGVLGYDQGLETPPQDQDGDVPMSGGEGAAAAQQQQQATSSSSGRGNPFQGLEDFSRKVPPPSLAPRLHCVCE